MNIKHVFTDVDLTLVGRNHVLTERNIEVIKRIREMGIGFYLQSGRVGIALQEILDPLNMNHSDKEFVIGGNGAIVSDTNLHCLVDEYIEDADLLKLIDYFNSVEDCAFSLVCMEKYYSFREISGVSRNKYHVSQSVTFDEVRSLVGTKRFYKFLAQNNNPQILDKMATKISEITNGNVIAVKSTFNNLEVIKKGVSKGNGLKFFCQHMGIDLKEVLVIGDNYNDISMIDIAGFSACPANAVDEVKVKCNYVSPYDCTQSAVADILEKMIIDKQ